MVLKATISCISNFVSSGWAPLTRRPGGAGMLITRLGNLTVLLVAGVRRRCPSESTNVIFQQESMLVNLRYTDEDDSEIGIGLGW